MAVNRWVVSIIGALWGVSLTAAGPTTPVTLLVSGLTPGKGQLLVAICDEQTFLRATCFEQSTVNVDSEPQRVLLEGVPQGRWAAAIVYDTNSNGQLETNFLGIPKEPVGVSRNASGFFGPPKFKDAAFDLQGESALLEIRVK